MWFYLSCVVLLLGIIAVDANENCPPVSSLACMSDESTCEGMNLKQAFIFLNNDVRCLGCRVCIRNHGNHDILPNPGRFPPLNAECPRVACYAMRIPDGCTPVRYSQKVLIGLRLCPVCSTFRCTNM